MSDSNYRQQSNDFIIHQNIVEKAFLDSPYSLTARFYDVSGAEAEQIYNTAINTQQHLQKGNSALLQLTQYHLQTTKKPNIDLVQDILSMQYCLSELMRGIQLSIFTVAGTAELFEHKRLRRERK